jgi:BlaI family penicillinase repressor
MTTSDLYAGLSRREREIMDVVYARGRATAAEVRELLKPPPSYSAVRAMLRILEEKEVLRHEVEGVTYVFLPVHSKTTASRSAVRRLLDTFYGGSPSSAVAALLDVSSVKLSAKERERLLRLIREAEGRAKGEER